MEKFGEDIIVSEKENIVTLTINREDKKNTLTPNLLNDFFNAFKVIEGDMNPRVIILRGAGEKVFCAGYDIRELAVESKEDFATESVRLFESALKAVRDCSLPVIAMLNGHVVGGGLDLAVSCDFRICHPGVKLGITPARLGLVYHYSGIQRFLNLVGLSATRQLFLTGDLIDPEKALSINLVDYVVKQEDLEYFTYNFASKMATQCAPIPLKGMKSVINMLTETSNLNIEEKNVALNYMKEAFFSSDVVEGITAFAEKRKPNFKGE